MMNIITGVILAGGQGSRMQGKDKGLIMLHGQSLYKYALQRMKLQVNKVLISANRNIAYYQSSGYPVVTDLISNYQGPIAGFLSGLYYSSTEWTAFCACDMPYFPSNYIETLWKNLNGAPTVWARSSKYDFPILALINKSLLYPLENWIAQGGRSIKDFLKNQGGHSIQVTHHDLLFYNINTVSDLIYLKNYY